MTNGQNDVFTVLLALITAAQTIAIAYIASLAQKNKERHDKIDNGHQETKE